MVGKEHHAPLCSRAPIRANLHFFRRNMFVTDLLSSSETNYRPTRAERAVQTADACWSCNRPLLPCKETLFVIPVTSILEKLPTVRAEDTRTVPYQYSGTNPFNRSVTRAEYSPRQWKWQPKLFSELLGDEMVS